VRVRQGGCGLFPGPGGRFRLLEGLELRLLVVRGRFSARRVEEMGWEGWWGFGFGRRGFR